MFQELGDSITDVGELSNFWIVEGIAVYMESLATHDGYVTPGGVDAERLQYARVRALSGEFYLPLSDLVHRRHRQALVDFITLLYLGRAQPNTLASRCGVQFEALDKEYVTFLGVRDEDLAHLNPPSVVKNLAFGRTSITDAGLESLAKYTALEWLDLSFTKTTDAGLKHLEGALDLKRLSLEGTAITDTSVGIISRYSQLEELDLSDTKITDAGVAHLAQLTRLKVLWLTNTQISDQCLVRLRALTTLEFLEVSQTNVSADALAKLKAELPQLNRE
ncbi:MAG: leucine-rich repeat domain-containing protein [Planctomycetia bacterium]|nr:leucine-rich repeat domain-containing protein [Planctomycetia bacterium]